MEHESIQIIHDEHRALAAMLRSIGLLVDRGPDPEPQKFFDVLRAMLFYIDEFPERLHHTKESELLFPQVAKLAPETSDVLAKLEKDHVYGGIVRCVSCSICCWPGSCWATHGRRRLSRPPNVTWLFTWTT